MSKIDMSKFSAAELEEIAAQAKEQAKAKRKEEKAEQIEKAGKWAMKHRKEILNSSLPEEIKQALAGIVGKTTSDSAGDE